MGLQKNPGISFSFDEGTRAWSLDCCSKKIKIKKKKKKKKDSKTQKSNSMFCL